MRYTVGMIVGQIGSGRSVAEVLSDFPELQDEDVMQSLRYAACLAQDPATAETKIPACARMTADA